MSAPSVRAPSVRAPSHRRARGAGSRRLWARCARAIGSLAALLALGGVPVGSVELELGRVELGRLELGSVARAQDGGVRRLRRYPPASQERAPRASDEAASDEPVSGRASRRRASDGASDERTRQRRASETESDEATRRPGTTDWESDPPTRRPRASETASDETASDETESDEGARRPRASDSPRTRDRASDAAPGEGAGPASTERTDAAGAAESPVSPAQAIEPVEASSGEAPPGALTDGGVPPLDGGASDALLSDRPLDAGAPEDAGALAAPAPDAGAGLATDAGVDAGPLALPDAGVAAAPPADERASDAGSVRAFFEELAQRFGVGQPGEREPTARDAEAPPAPGGPQEADGPPAAPESEVINELVREWLGVEPPPSFGLVVFLALAVLALWLIDRARKPLPERGLFPRVLAAARLVVRLSIVLLALMLVSRLLPHWLHPALLLTVAAIAVALGFGAVWVLLPDVVGAVVLLTEGRLKRGQWVAGEGFAGTVEHLGPRVTLLRAADGALLSVPNRRVVKSPIRASDRPWHEVDADLRAPAGVPAPRLREAIREAVLCSPFVPPDPGLVLARDPRDPDRWRLKVRLIDVRHSAAFEGQLLERIEESLATELPAE